MSSSMMTSQASVAEVELPQVDIKQLLSRLWPLDDDAVKADEIAEAISYLFTNQISDVQSSALLVCLHFTGLDHSAEVLAKTAVYMGKAAARIDSRELAAVVERRGRKEGGYHGGLVDIVGTGGDSHSTFNISTTSSIIASSLLLVAKHGNKASTSKSGSADILSYMQPRAPQIGRVRPDTLALVLDKSNYAFLFAPIFHPGMRHIAPIRRLLPWRTLFNLIGPLVNPADVAGPVSGGIDRSLLEARVVGVARRELGPVFSDALKMAGARKAMVVCGDEELDEISCAGPTHCWSIRPDPRSPQQTLSETFTLQPDDFGLPAHALSTVSPGKEPAENAAMLRRILTGQMANDDPILHFVLMNTAALFVVSGLCEADSSNMGFGDDGQVIKTRGPGGGRWKEGIRRARWAIKSGEAARQWDRFVHVSNSFQD